MPVSLSKRVQKVKPSPTLAVTARAAKLKAEGKDIIGHGAGEPDFDTPLHIADAGVDAIRKGVTRYTAVDGTAELKDAIIAKFKRDNELTYERSQILVSSGAKQTCFNLCAALLDPGDECVIPAPYWVSYPDMVILADGVPVCVYGGADQGYKITPAQLSAAITPRTKMLFLNSPSNPTGAAYTRAELQALGAVLDRHPQIIIASDEMYEHIYWAAEPFSSFAQANPQLYDRTVTINGVSKAYAMTGWRIGYCGGPKELVAAMGTIQGQSTSNASSIVADRYVFACGPWLGKLFPQTVGPHFISTRQEVFFFGTPAGDPRYNEGNVPVWGDHSDHFMYGIPGNQGRGFKIADDTRGPEFDPTSGQRLVSEDGLADARRYLAYRFPGMKDAPLLETRVCQYENTTDHNFIIDRHPRNQNVWIVGGGSGHGFKHGPALGEMVAKLVLKDETADPLYRLTRFAANSAK